MTTSAHDFYEDLAWSHRLHMLPVWEQLYAQAFPSASFHLHSQDGEHQRAGIDRTIVLPNSKCLYVDEKARRPIAKRDWPYDDILLEFESNDRTHAPGWATKALRCDFIAYAVLQLGKVYMLPVIQLQQAWSKYGAMWLDKFGVRAAQNHGYRTLNCPVPIDRLFGAIGSCLRFQCEPISYEQLALFEAMK